MAVVNGFLTLPGAYLVLATGGTDKLIVDQFTLQNDVKTPINMGAYVEAIIQSQTVAPVGIVPVGSFNLNSVITLPNPTFVERTLSIGTNTSVPIAAGATVIVITPPSSNTTQLTLKGVSGDTGILINASQPSIFTLDPSQNTIILNAATGTVVCQFTYI